MQRECFLAKGTANNYKNKEKKEGKISKTYEQELDYLFFSCGRRGYFFSKFQNNIQNPKNSAPPGFNSSGEKFLSSADDGLLLAAGSKTHTFVREQKGEGVHPPSPTVLDFSELKAPGAGVKSYWSAKNDSKTLTSISSPKIVLESEMTPECKAIRLALCSQETDGGSLFNIEPSPAIAKMAKLNSECEFLKLVQGAEIPVAFSGERPANYKETYYWNIVHQFIKTQGFRWQYEYSVPESQGQFESIPSGNNPK